MKMSLVTNHHHSGMSEGVVNSNAETPTLSEEEDDKEGDDKGELSGDEEIMEIAHEKSASKEGSQSPDDKEEDKVLNLNSLTPNRKNKEVSLKFGNSLLRPLKK